MKYDTIIHNGTLITINPKFDIIANGMIGICDGKIAIIEAGLDASEFESSEIINADGGLILPGIVNTHTHLPMTLFRGLADDLPLQEWLHQHIFPTEARCLNPDSVRYGTLLACAELMLSGVTTCCDGYFYEDTVAQAVEESGMRAVLGQGVIDFPAPGVPNPSDNIRCALEFIETWQHRSSLITPSIFCHSPLTCSATTLQQAKKLADLKGIVFQIHIAETQEEFSRIQTEHGLTPVGYLEQLGILDQHTLLVHAIWVDEADRQIIAKRRASVSVAVESEMKLGSGITPIPQMLHDGIPVGLGTDGCASNNDLDMFREMGMTAKLHKVHSQDPSVMDARTVLTLATLGGAKAIGMDHLIGSIEVGKQADILIMDTNQPHLTPLYHPVSHIVYAASGSDVRDVMIAGKWIVRNRQLQRDVLKSISRDTVSEALSDILQSDPNKTPALS